MDISAWKKRLVYCVEYEPIIRKYGDGAEKIIFTSFEGSQKIIKKYPNNKVSSIEHFGSDGEYYREDGPALLEYFESGKPEVVQFSKNIDRGQPTLEECLSPTNTKGASKIRYHISGTISRKEYRTTGSMPNVVGFYGSGQISGIEYNFLKREDVPSCWKYTKVTFYRSGAIMELAYIIDGKLCTPLSSDYQFPFSSYRIYYENGYLKFKSYHNEKGRYHRCNGPAAIDYYPNGTIITETFIEDGDIK